MTNAKTIWINIASPGPDVSVEELREMAATAEPVPVGPYCDMGETSGYEMRGDDLWAKVPAGPRLRDYARAAAIIASDGYGKKRLLTVLLSNLSREELLSLVRPESGKQ